MGKRIQSQARGRGGPAYKVRKQAYKHKIIYPPMNVNGYGNVIKLIDSGGHSAPLAKIMIGKHAFFNSSAQGLFEGQQIEINKNGRMDSGDIVSIENVPIGTRIFNIEKRPGDGGKMTRTGGGFATVLKKDESKVVIVMSNKKEVILHPKCRVTIGVIAGQGRVVKPLVKAGKMHKIMVSKGRKWHRTSAVKVNAVDHPFGGGRGKRIKSKIAKRNAPPGRKVGHIRPSRTGKK